MNKELKAPNITVAAKNSEDQGNQGWVKGPVTITIADTAEASETTATYIYYEITNIGTNAKEKGGPITGTNTTIDFNKNGQYIVKAWIQDGNMETSNKSVEKTESFKIDTDKPAVANITVASTNQGPGTNIETKEYYYNTRATVIVEPRIDVTSGVYGVRIEVTGANEIAINNYEVTTSKEIEITKAGTSTVKAWTIDKAGNISQEATTITINLNNTVPKAPTLTVATAHSAYSTDQDPWYNNEAVQIDITGETNQDIYQIIYGTRTKGSTAEPSNLKTLSGTTQTLSITDEGKQEVVAYTINKYGKKSEAGTKTVQIDRTKPTVASLDCIPGDGAILMTANNASDNENGSGIAEYMFFVDNKAGSEDTIVRNEIGDTSKPEPHKATFETSMGRYLGQVAVVDKAGNISAVQGNGDARTMMYKYTSTQNARWRWWYVCTRV